MGQLNGQLREQQRGHYVPDSLAIDSRAESDALNKFLSSSQAFVLDNIFDDETLEKWIMSLNSINGLASKASNTRVLQALWTENALRQLHAVMCDLPIRGKIEINMIASTKRLHVNFLRGFTIHQTLRLLRILLKSLRTDTKSAAKSKDQVAEDLCKEFTQRVMNMSIGMIDSSQERTNLRVWWTEQLDNDEEASQLLHGKGSAEYSKRATQFLENPNEFVPNLPRPTPKRREQTLRLLRDQITRLGWVNRGGYEKTLEEIPFPNFIDLLQNIVEDIAAAYLTVKCWATPDQVSALMLTPTEHHLQTIPTENPRLARGSASEEMVP